MYIGKIGVIEDKTYELLPAEMKTHWHRLLPPPSTASKKNYMNVSKLTDINIAQLKTMKKKQKRRVLKKLGIQPMKNQKNTFINMEGCKG